MKFTDLEYGVLMQAINNAKAELADGDFIDPYAENPEGYTEKDIENALETVEKKIMVINN